MSNQRYRLDRTAYRVTKADDPLFQQTDYRSLSWQERMYIANYLIAAAWNFEQDKWPRMDKTAFQIKHRD